MKNLEEKIIRASKLNKCRKCKCFEETLATIRKQLEVKTDEVSLSIKGEINKAISNLLPSEYT